MTEAKWLACDNPARLLDSFQGKTSDRKVLLFGTACLRAYEPHDRKVLRRCSVAERFVDGLAGLRELHTFWAASRDSQGITPPERPWPWASHWAGSRLPVPSPSQMADYIRDIFGNPFRPVTLDSSWLSSTVVTLAGQMYEG